ncbi:hypothetical protein [Oscillatoria salina]|uniref:hypothetical protein n=1 Tax=Oscillatoria salina TaxID=331517 RepID=UPI001CCEA528|nr:hypothetical protein [Oscillatoria salina]
MTAILLYLFTFPGCQVGSANKSSALNHDFPLVIKFLKPLQLKHFGDNFPTRQGRVLIKKILSGTLLTLILFGCRSSQLAVSGWEIYRNQRYNFEFPYPSNWIALPMPDNRDGQIFQDPSNPSVEIRGWAGNSLSGIEIEIDPRSHHTDHQSIKTKPENLITEQGLTGKLYIEIGSEISLMKLTLLQGDIQYNWRGEAESEEFANYYRLFDFIATRYRVLPPEE